jgi:hypothetical protein
MSPAPAGLWAGRNELFAHWYRGACCASSGFCHASGADAIRAHADLLANAFDHRAHAAEIRVPATTASIIRVADYVSKMRPFAAKFTLHRHIHS